MSKQDKTPYFVYYHLARESYNKGNTDKTHELLKLALTLAIGSERDRVNASIKKINNNDKHPFSYTIDLNPF